MRLKFFMLITFYSVIGFAQNKADFEILIKETVTNQMTQYPVSTLKDLYKNFFQDYFGPGHIISNSEAAENYLKRELDSFRKSNNVYAEPTGWNHNFYRVNLSVIKDSLVSYNLYLNSFIESVNNIKPITIEEWKKEWGQIETIIRAMNLSLPDYETDLEEINQGLEKGEYVGHHSKIYEETYDPHYRIISSSIYEERIKPLINKQ